MKRTPLKRKTPLRAKKWWRPKRKRLPQMSAKRKIEKPIYDREAAEFLQEHPHCEFFRWRDGTPAPIGSATMREVKRTYSDFGEPLVAVEFSRQCRRRSAQVHHIRRRGKWYLDKRYWFPSCNGDHAWIEANGKEAERLGYLERIYEKH